MKNVSSKINDHDADKLIAVFGSKYEGVKRAVEGFMAIRDYSLAEIRKLNFTTEELTSMISSLNGTMSSNARMQCNVGAFNAHMEDFEKLDNGVSSYGADYNSLMKKLENLSAAQVFFLQDEIYRWWEINTDMEGFISSLQPKAE